MRKTTLPLSTRIALVAIALVVAMVIAGGPAAQEASGQLYTVNVHITGSGTGTVYGDEHPFSCTKTGSSDAKCSVSHTWQFPIDFYVTVQAAPTFGGWGGSCQPHPTGNPLYCRVAGNATVEAQFNSMSVNPSLVTDVVWLPGSPKSESVMILGAGTGTGSVVGPGINCTITAGVASSGGTCAKHFSVNSTTTRTYTAAPAAGHSFAGWTGACSGVSPSCSITGSGTATARFDPLSPGGPGSPPPGAGQDQGQGGHEAGDHNRVEAEILTVKVKRSKLGKRLIAIEIRAGEPVRAFLSLERRGNSLLSKKKQLNPGERVITLIVPNGIAKGRAVLVATFEDGGGVLDLSKSLRLPRA